jgi:hypothetical protein
VKPSLQKQRRGLVSQNIPPSTSIPEGTKLTDD